MMDGLLLEPASASVFRLENREAWKRWRARKLAARPARAGALVVHVRDPRALTRVERGALVERCARANMAFYASGKAPDDPSIPLCVAAQLGLKSPDVSPPAEGDGVARVPWHTEGYRNPPGLPVRSSVTHCAYGAAELSLVDPELAWLLLRDAGEPFVRALMQHDAFAIPGRLERHPVFAIDAGSGDLQLRFTERRDAIEWKFDATVSEAAARMRRLLDREASCVMRVRLEPGMGMVSNNVLHTRAMAIDDARSPRRLLRLRFRERIAGTEGAWRGLV